MFKEVTGVNMPIKNQRKASLLGFVLWPIVWVKWKIPLPLRYLWWLVWSRVLELGQFLHKQVVLQGKP